MNLIGRVFSIPIYYMKRPLQIGGIAATESVDCDYLTSLPSQSLELAKNWKIYRVSYDSILIDFIVNAMNTKTILQT